MKNYLIVVQGKGHFDHLPVLLERFAHKKKSYAQGVHRGVKMAYPNNEVYLEEINEVNVKK